MDTKQQLRRIFRTMDAHRAQEIREAYFKAHEGLITLVQELELADADLADSPTPLLDEHMYAIMVQTTCDGHWELQHLRTSRVKNTT